MSSIFSDDKSTFKFHIFSKIHRVPRYPLIHRMSRVSLVYSFRYVGKYSSNFLFIDEAAQAMEPEAACAISLLAPRKGIVLAGDPYQLGPVTNSLFSAQHGLG